MKRNLSWLLVTALMVVGTQKQVFSASVELDWIFQQQRSAVGNLDGVLITAATSADAQFVSIINGRFQGDEWNTGRALSVDAEALVVSDANPGDTHTFIFTQTVPDLLLYVENFDSNSLATVTAEGTGSLSLLEGSASISFAATSGRSGILSTSNVDSDGEGDLIISLEGPLDSVSFDFTSGDGQNGVFYTFAVAIPEPGGLGSLGLGSILLGTIHRRRRLQGNNLTSSSRIRFVE